MSAEFKTLQIADHVLAGNSEFVDYVVPNGMTISIDRFKGNDSTSAMASCRLIWDYGVTNEILFVINNGPGLEVSIEKTGDGVKKLALVLNNNCTSDYDMSAECGFWEK
jgi:hypothetical protein